MGCECPYQDKCCGAVGIGLGPAKRAEPAGTATDGYGYGIKQRHLLVMLELG